jgi:rare lipoprotein A
VNFRRVIIVTTLGLIVVATMGIGIVRFFGDEATTQTGMASWYGPGFHGKKTASGEIFSQNEMTAASRTLPLGTRVMVTNLANGKQAEVTVNDRGPYVDGRIIDLSKAAARKLGLLHPGTARVRIEVISDEIESE